MKRFYISEICLISKEEKKAKRVSFHPKITIIQGRNSTGKSCLVKSIYRTFGADTKIHPLWERSHIISLIKFNVDGKNFSILRRENNIFAVFNQDKEVIGVFNGVRQGFAAFLADLLDFKIKLDSSKDNQPKTPPPAYLFLPYYIDQDLSWKEPWKSFLNLRNEFTNWYVPLAEYHTGIKPNEYYEIKAENDKLKREKKGYDNQVYSISNLIKNIDEKLTNSSNINIDMEQFKEEVKELIKECEKLSKQQELYKNKLQSSYNRKIRIKEQIKIVVHTIKEINLDYRFALSAHDEVECPTCGAMYENSFLERFAIAQDEQECNQLFNSLNDELLGIENDIEAEDKNLKKIQTQITLIENILAKKQGEIKLKDVIEAQSRKEVKQVLVIQKKEINNKVLELAQKMYDYTERLKKYNDSERRSEIKYYYQNRMKLYLDKLDVTSVSEDSYKRLIPDIRELGSTLPRAILAYHFSVLQTINKYGSSAFCPIVIDNPNQQQDSLNLNNILGFIKDNIPNKSQLILCLEEMPQIPFDGEIVELSNYRQLLQEDEYDDIEKEVKSYVDLAMKAYETDPQINKGNLFGQSI